MRLVETILTLLGVFFTIDLQVITFAGVHLSRCCILFINSFFHITPTVKYNIILNYKRQAYWQLIPLIEAVHPYNHPWSVFMIKFNFGWLNWFSQWYIHCMDFWKARNKHPNIYSIPSDINWTFFHCTATANLVYFSIILPRYCLHSCTGDTFALHHWPCRASIFSFIPWVFDWRHIKSFVMMKVD